MSVIRLDIHAEVAPNGAVLGSLTEEDLKDGGFSMRVTRDKFENGAGLIELNRHHPNSDLLVDGNWVRVYIPFIDPDVCLFMFELSEDATVLLAGEKGRGGENITLGGPSAFDYLRTSLLDESKAGAGPSVIEDARWHWDGASLTAILEEMLDEDAAKTTPFLPELTHDFTATDDSASNPSIVMYDDFGVAIGSDLAISMRRVAQTDDDFTLLMDYGTEASPVMLLRAFNTYGTDRTSATFAAGKVLLNDSNTLTDLTRRGRGTKLASHALVGGSNGQYHREVRGDWAPVTERPRQTWLSWGEVRGPIVLGRLAQAELNNRLRAKDGIDLEIDTGDDEANGKYLPFKHIIVGDSITLDTGSGFHDFVDRACTVSAIRIELAEAASDADDYSRAKSLLVAVELNAEGGGGDTAPGLGGLSQTCDDCPGSQHIPPVCDCAEVTIPAVDFCGTVPTS